MWRLQAVEAIESYSRLVDGVETCDLKMVRIKLQRAVRNPDLDLAIKDRAEKFDSQTKDRIEEEFQSIDPSEPEYVQNLRKELRATNKGVRSQFDNLRRPLKTVFAQFPIRLLDLRR